jgi:hypothetical protein
VFPGDTRKLMDMRRSGVVEAIAGGTDAVGLSAKLANSIGRSNALHKTYAPIEIEAVREAPLADQKASQIRDHQRLSQGYAVGVAGRG